MFVLRLQSAVRSRFAIAADWATAARPRTGLAGAACLTALLTSVAVAGCGSSGNATTSANPDAVDVVATTTQLGDMVRAIGGDAANVHQILQPNSDPHEYEPRPADVVATANAKIVFESGNDLDHWAGTVIEQSGGKPVVVTAADSNTDRVAGDAEAQGEHAGDGHAAAFDPHWWHDPRNVEAFIPVVRDALIKANPSQAAVYTANAAAYLKQVRALDAAIAKCLSVIPAGQRKLVTSHDAFGYLAKRYDLDIIGAVIPSQTTQAQPSAGEISALTEQVKREGVKAIYPETSINPKLSEALAKATGATSDHQLYGDTLGPEDSPAATYIGMEQANANALLQGLTGTDKTCAFPPVS